MNLIELHILQSFPVTCLNRDRFGAPKSAMFGGFERARVSSQCWKRPTRELAHEMMPAIFGASRSKILGPAIERAARELGADEWTTAAVKELVLTVMKKDNQHPGWVTTLFFFSPESLKNVIRPLIEVGIAISSLQASDAVKKLLFDMMGTDEAKWKLVHAALAFILDKFSDILQRINKCDKLAEIWTDLDSEDDWKKKNAKKSIEEMKKKLEKDLDKETKEAKKEVKKQKKNINLPSTTILERFSDNVTDAADIALFGRMVADDPSQTVEGAAMFSHAISTHVVRSELDFFSAVDDEKKDTDDADDAGAGHLGEIEFNSACYYRYVGINLDLLDPEKDKNNCNFFDTAQKKAILENFIKAALLAVPSARKNSMAGPTRPSYVLAVKRSGQPLSLANAFETPVAVKKGGGYIEPSVIALEDEWITLKDAFGIKVDVLCKLDPKKVGKAEIDNPPLAGLVEKLLNGIG